jgi:predicted DsbA family dithiol-disulfide isomerase
MTCSRSIFIQVKIALHGFTAEEAQAILADPAEQVETERQTAASRAKGARSVPTFDIGGSVMGGGRKPKTGQSWSGQ